MPTMRNPPTSCTHLVATKVSTPWYAVAFSPGTGIFSDGMLVDKVNHIGRALRICYLNYSCLYVFDWNLTIYYT